MSGDSLAGVHTVGRWLTDRAAIDPARVAVDDGGVRTTYAELAARASQLAGRLAEAGYAAGDRIATLSANSTDHVVAFFACALSGIAFVPLSWRLTPRELTEAIERSEPVLVLVDEGYLAAAEETRETRRAPRALLGTTGVEHAVPPRDAVFGPPAQARDARDDDALLVIFTSGSEARPKAVELTHANCFWTNEALGGAAQLTASDVVLAVLPQFHVAAWNCLPLLAWRAGATVVLERSFQPGRVLQLIADRQVTAMMGVPTQYRLLADAPGFADAELQSLRLALVGGSTVPAALAARWAGRDVPLVQGYGLTEAGPNVACASGPRARAGSIGVAYPHVQLRVVDPDSGLVLEGPAVGELQVAGPSVFARYLDDEAATTAARDGVWLRTGDLVERDAAGEHRVVDRLKDIYISGGENVAPAEVEDAIRQHPLVADVAVVGVPDDVWGERGVAFVVSSSPVSEDEILAHARGLLAGFKVPVRVAFVDELPRSTIEKLARSRLRDAARALGEEGRDVRARER